MDDKKKAAIKRLWQAQDATHKLESFWQDHFYSSRNRFGYPVCVQLRNTLTSQVEENVIIAWRTSEYGCERVLSSIQAYIDELDATKAKQ